MEKRLHAIAQSFCSNAAMSESLSQQNLRNIKFAMVLMHVVANWERYLLK
ncbi:hypothetical protein [Chroococcidiopsis cubana]|nr:hypothetical protein [Chroococcidiopsis cubana]